MNTARTRRLFLPVLLVLGSAVSTDASAPPASGHPMFQESERCIACHSNLTAPSGQDISIGYQWRATMMALSARDPYWRASVRRESIDHPTALAAIEDKCSVCHMPVAHTLAMAAGQRPQLFSLLEAAATDPGSVHRELDGVSCTVCHQIKPDNLGQRESFDGGYRIDATAPPEGRPLYGPYPVDVGRQRVMHSSTEHFVPTESVHIRQSELCATCHTLYTTALDSEGKSAGELPEQMPYLEWKQSDFVNRQSCQDCHMPVVNEAVPISAILGQKRAGVSQHVFVGGNAYMLRVLNKYRDELGIVAQPGELEASALRTEEFLNTRTAQLAIGSLMRSEDRARFTVTIRNLSGHKFPTAYPSRRAWLHVTVSDEAGTVVFESGAKRANGSIIGNDNDENPDRFEPHHDVIRGTDDVQIYESIMVDASARVTTSLLSGVRFIKDNRLLPAGFNKATSGEEIAVQGEAKTDADFSGGGDAVHFDVGTPGRGVLTVRAELNFQPTAYRWAQNLKRYDASEIRTFIDYYQSTASSSASLVATATTSGS